MPSGLILHEGNAFALERLHDDGAGTSFGFMNSAESAADLIEIVPVDPDDPEAERFKFLIDGIRGIDITDPSVDLQIIVVDDDGQIVQFLGSCKHGGFPYFTFFDLTVSEQCIDMIGFVLQLCGKRHACCGGNTLSQGARTHIQSGEIDDGGMSLQAGTRLSQGNQFLFGEIAALCHDGIERRRTVTLGQDKAVPVFICRVLRVDVHFFEIQISEQVRTGERSARMTGFRGMDFRYDIPAYCICVFFQFFVSQDKKLLSCFGIIITGFTVSRRLVMHNFGRTKDGRDVHLFRLENDHYFVEVTDYGASLVTFLDKRAGIDIVQGYTDVRGYEDLCPYMGATVGRICNRVRDGYFLLDGVPYKLEENDCGNCLHGGSTSTAFKVWEGRELEDRLSFRCFSPDGEGGFPGNVTMCAEYILEDDGLRIELSAESDKDTYIALTNHAFFNLNGPQSRTVLDHELMIESDVVCAIDRNGQTGEETFEAEDTPFDFRMFKKIGLDIDNENEQLTFGGGYDHCFVIRGEGFRHCAAVKTERIRLDVWSDLPGLQIYSGNFLSGEGQGKNGGTFPKRSAVCLEAQYIPNAVNSETYEKPLVRAGEKQCHVICYRTSLNDAAI